MKIILFSTDSLFVEGGSRRIVEWLEIELVDRGHEVERIYLPEIDAPELILRQMAALRMINFAKADLVICFRPQSHLIQHPKKVLWFIHHVRSFYDLWDTEHRTFPDDDRHRAIRDVVHEADTVALAEASKVFTNSAVVSQRLAKFNGITSEVLYPPLHRPERFRFEEMNDEIVCVSRLQAHKRQHLLVEALEFTRTPVRLRLCGASSGPDYPGRIAEVIERLDLSDRVVFENVWLAETVKQELLARCLAVAYVPENEDSYGYVALEAAHSRKPILTTTDSGGVLEFVEDGENGLVAAPDSRSIAAAMDRLFENQVEAKAMGTSAQARVEKLGISWDAVVERLLA